MIDKYAKIFIAGRNGMVGSSIENGFKKRGYKNIIGLSSSELDLTKQLAVKEYFLNQKPEYVILAAAKVGGIMANMQSPAEFLYDNLAIQNNVIHYAYKYKAKKLLFLASSCIYPRMSPQPMKEEYLMDGKLEPTNEGYAIAKIAGLKMCQMYNKQYNVDFISVMPCNVYGIGDNFDLEKSHVVAALIRKFHEAKLKKKKFVEVWGTGNARRELIFNEDLADACLFLFESYTGNDLFNIGTGIDISIKKLAHLIKQVVGYKGIIKFDITKPDGMPQKLLDVSRLRDAGWIYKTSLEEGLKKTYSWFLEQQGN
ncbi:NAD-dependent epimerase/dehydratase family protein [Iocasia frigidifontis]|uniref:GDP-L-fucose synthase n=1 Tax=Iocasia fonsfrigidae TaxID=2682810 RepID=A0A8A7KDN8_9FIRM|nr:GDP-L-fucose synthase [Iocasia fonsfrigidae]QTL97718.1 NAD-dependent epimerase/dehydratase family protein [Iocasia fonsfrigidae]